MQANAVHALHAGHRVMIAAPDSFGTIGVLFDLEMCGQECCRAMVLGPVELNAAAHPGPCQAHQGRFDHRLIIDEVVTVAFVLQNVNPPADFWEHHGTDELVFEDRKSTRLNSSHSSISYAVFCLKKK